MFTTVKWFDGTRGYGFLSHPHGGNDVFVHARAVKGPKPTPQPALAAGDQVEFDVETEAGQRGTYHYKEGYAKDVVVVKRINGIKKAIA